MAEFRFDWYQVGGTVTLSCYVKNVQEDSVKVDLDGQCLNLCFSDNSGAQYSRSFSLLHPIKDFKVSVGSVKLELQLSKVNGTCHWTSLESTEKGGTSIPKYPTSSRKPVDLDSLVVEEDPVSGEAQVEQFFKALYKDADDDTRRAMQKSFVQNLNLVSS